MDTREEWRKFIFQCHAAELNASEIKDDKLYQACTVEYRKGHAHVICPRILDDHNLIEIHIFYADKLHAMYTRKHLDGMMVALINWILYAEAHKKMLEIKYRFAPNDYGLKKLEKDYRPLNTDDLLKKFIPAKAKHNRAQRP